MFLECAHPAFLTTCSCYSRNSHFHFLGAYTHHQKTVICDADDPNSIDGRRRLIAYVGGLDLTGGRYDTPEHEIFCTLRTDHAADFRNSNAKMLNGNVGPREPWHDIHSKVEVGVLDKIVFVM